MTNEELKTYIDEQIAALSNRIDNEIVALSEATKNHIVFLSEQIIHLKDGTQP